MDIKKLREKITSLGATHIILSSHRPVHDSMSYMSNDNMIFDVVLGSYKGETETSFITTSDNLEDIQELIEGQESLLLLSNPQKDGSREMNLLFVESNDHDFIGMMVELTSEDALATDAWSYLPSINAYFGARVSIKD